MVASKKTQFYATIDVEPLTAQIKFEQLVDEVVELFTTQPRVKVKLKIEVEASSEVGFEESLQRSVKENCNVLKFKNYAFD